ncbi:DUF421 domain-containing protein [Paenibacillus faecalis]|uniref:YetF domain-containing protein n=1 Tax=Paenibacillus faecalis TaxID=2079532 RepID=UPI000D0E78F7|nr:DUF421 domain-containing protein [Paenibacillus faecalis]
MAEHVTLLIFRTILMYGITFLTLRIMGKREIGKLSIFDLVISIMIAEIAIFVLEDVKKPLIDGIIPIVVLVTIQVVLAYWGLKSRKVRLLADGKPSILVSRGKLHRKEMSRLRYNLDDLMQQLRGKDINSLSDVEFAILETSGQLTVIPKDQANSSDGSSPSTAEDESLNTKFKHDKDMRSGIDIPYGKITYEALPVPLIMDGKVQDENLVLIGKSRQWLKHEIQKHGAQDFEEVFLCSMDHKGRLYVDRNDT